MSLGTVAGAVYKPADETPDGSPALQAAYMEAMPALAFCLRLSADPVVIAWVDQLHRLDPAFRLARAKDLAKGAPRGLGREVVTELLMRGAKNGATGWIASAGSFGAYFNGSPSAGSPRRKMKAGFEQDKMAGLAETANRIVRRVTAFPVGLVEPEANTDAARRAEQRMLQEVAARLRLRGGAVRSPSGERRAAG